MSVKKDQILWGRSPLRLDLAGGLTIPDKVGHSFRSKVGQ